MKFLIITLVITIGSSLGDDALKDLQNANIQFSASLYQQLIKNEPGKNIIVSPLSIQLALALTQLGAKGDTAIELAKGLRLPDSPEKVKEAFKLLIPALKGNQYYKLNSANKIYVKENYTLNNDFQKLAKDVFDAGLENIDFVDTVGASETINKWVSEKTNDKIKKLIRPDMLDAMTRLILVNAIYFYANWSSPFEASHTTKRTFYKTEKEEIQVDTMQLTETLRYAENKDLDARFLEIPYEGDEATFTIVLPNQKEGLSSLEGRLGDVLVQHNYSYERVNLYMPKFEIESTFKLVPALKELGIKKVFDDSEADLSGLLANKEPLVISDVIQKAFINVTETGTEAAAATVVALNRILFDQSTSPIEFKVEKPFLYFISKGGNILFLGRITVPTV